MKKFTAALLGVIIALTCFFSLGGAGAFYENELNADGDDPYLPLVKNKCEAAIEETIPAEEFHRIRAELEKDLVPVELDWHPLETYAQNGSKVTVTRTMIIPIGLICALAVTAAVAVVFNVKKRKNTRKSEETHPLEEYGKK